MLTPERRAELREGFAKPWLDRPSLMATGQEVSALLDLADESDRLKARCGELEGWMSCQKDRWTRILGGHGWATAQDCAKHALGEIAVFEPRKEPDRE